MAKRPNMATGPQRSAESAAAAARQERINAWNAPTKKPVKTLGTYRVEVPRTKGMSPAARAETLRAVTAAQFRNGRFDRDTRNARAEAITRATETVVRNRGPLVRTATMPSGKTFTVGANAPMIGGRRAAVAFTQIRAAGPNRLGDGILAAKAGATKSGSGGGRSG